MLPAKLVCGMGTRCLLFSRTKDVPDLEGGWNEPLSAVLKALF